MIGFKSAELTAINVVERLKRENIFAVVTDLKITTEEGVFEISSDVKHITKTACNYLIPDDLGEEAIYAFICYIHKSKSVKEVERSAVNFVQSIGVPINLRGYSFLITAIVKGAAEPELLYPMSKGLFPVVAQCFSVDKRCVERNIRTAVDIAFDNNPEAFHKYFPCLKSKPYVSEVIVFAVDMILRELF